MSHIAYYRVSTSDQSIDVQRAALADTRQFDREFSDEGLSGAVLAADRPGFAKLLEYPGRRHAACVRGGPAGARYDRRAEHNRRLLDKGVAMDLKGLGRIAKGVGELIIAELAQVADMERQQALRLGNQITGKPSGRNAPAYLCPCAPTP